MAIDLNMEQMREQQRREYEMPAQSLQQLRAAAQAAEQPLQILGPLLTGMWGFIAGGPGVGKSTLSIAIARACVTGERLGPFEGSGQCNKVLIIDAEMSPLEIIGRWGEQLPDGVRYVTAESLGMQKHFNLAEDIERLKATVVDERVVIIDNVEFCLDPPQGKNIFDYETWRAVHPILNWAKSNGILLILIDHTNKDNLLGGQRNKQRGANFLMLLESHYIEDCLISFRSTFRQPKGKYRGICPPDQIRDTIWWLRDNGCWYSEPVPSAKQKVQSCIERGLNSTDAKLELVPADMSKSHFYKMWNRLSK